MDSKPKILCCAGSTRSGSFNKKLIKIAMEGASKNGADVYYIDLRDFPMPIYDGDFEVEKGLPGEVKKMKEIFLNHHGFLISAPEYNSSVSGVLKNTIDWLSRPALNESTLACFKDKFAGLMSASPGALGGLRGLADLRAILSNIGTHVIPHQVAIPRAHEAFNKDGSLKDTKQHSSVEQIGTRLAELISKVHS